MRFRLRDVWFQSGSGLPEPHRVPALASILFVLRDAENKRSEGRAVKTWFHYLGDWDFFPGDAWRNRFTSRQSTHAAYDFQNSRKLQNTEIGVYGLESGQSANTRLTRSFGTGHIQEFKTIYRHQVASPLVHFKLYQKVTAARCLVHVRGGCNTLVFNYGGDVQHLLGGIYNDLWKSIKLLSFWVDSDWCLGKDICELLEIVLAHADSYYISPFLSLLINVKSSPWEHSELGFYFCCYCCLAESSSWSYGSMSLTRSSLTIAKEINIVPEHEPLQKEGHHLVVHLLLIALVVEN